MIRLPLRPGDFTFPEIKSPRLRVVTYSDAVRTVTVSGLTPAGLINASITTTSDRAAQTTYVPITQIPTSVHISTSTLTDHPGRLYVYIVLEISGTSVATLIAGYVTTNSPLTWPGSHITPSTQGPGYPQTLTVDNPGAGGEVLYTIPGNTLLRVSSVRYLFTTSATAITRSSALVYLDPADTMLYHSPAVTTQAASLAQTYLYARRGYSVPLYSALVAGDLASIPLTTNFQIRTESLSLQGGDSYTTIVLTVEQWIIP